MKTLKIDLSTAITDLSLSRETLSEVWTNEENPEDKENLRLAYAALINCLELSRKALKVKSDREANERYQNELANHNEFYEAKKPKREHYPDDLSFGHAYTQWSFQYNMDKPNKPGYHRANND